MKRIMLLLLLVATGITNTYAQSFTDRLPTVKTGITACVTYDGAFLKVYGHEDLSNPIKASAKIELLNLKSINDNSSLPTLKLKVIDDNDDGSRNGLVGYMYPSLTSLTNVYSYTTNKVEFNFKTMLPTVTTGSTGTVTFDGGTLRVTGFDDNKISLPKGTKIELLSNKMIRAIDCLALNHIKVKVLEGANTGAVGYMYPSSTSFGDYADYTNETMNPPKGFTGTEVAKPTGKFADMLTTVNTGCTGEVTFEGGTLKMKTFDDVSPSLKKGAKIELLSNKMVKGTDSWGLYHIKVKVIDDKDGGANNGKVGYMYPSSTSFTNYAEYSSESINPPKGFTADPEANKSTTTTNAGSYDLPTYPTERTGITGNVNSVLGDAWAYEDGSDWVTEVYLPLNSKFDLLNKKVFKDAITGNNFIKVRVTYDPKGTFTNKIMWVDILDTSLSDRFDQSSSDPVVK